MSLFPNLFLMLKSPVLTICKDFNTHTCQTPCWWSLISCHKSAPDIGIAVENEPGPEDLVRLFKERPLKADPESSEDDGVFIERDSLISLHCTRGDSVTVEYYRVLCPFTKYYNT